MRDGPVLTAMALLGSAAVLGGAFFIAHQFSQGDDVPTVGLWADDGSDRLQVVIGDPDADWSQLRIHADGPIQYALSGAPSSSAAPNLAVPVAPASDPVVGGQRLSLCAVGEARTTRITIATARGDVLFEQELDLRACPGPGR